MIEVFGLILPLFGLILLGFLGAKLFSHPIEAMGWLNAFIIYFALPALFFNLLSRTPIEQLASWYFIIVAVGVTASILAITFMLGMIESRGNVAEAAIQALAGAYGNIGYMGPPIAILALGEPAAIPVAIIFCFENILHFVFAPAMMAMAGKDKRSVAGLILRCAAKDHSAPVHSRHDCRHRRSRIAFCSTGANRQADRLSGQCGGALRTFRNGRYIWL